MESAGVIHGVGLQLSVRRHSEQDALGDGCDWRRVGVVAAHRSSFERETSALGDTPSASLNVAVPMRRLAVY